MFQIHFRLSYLILNVIRAKCFFFASCVYMHFVLLLHKCNVCTLRSIIWWGICDTLASIHLLFSQCFLLSLYVYIFSLKFIVSQRDEPFAISNNIFVVVCLSSRCRSLCVLWQYKWGYYSVIPTSFSAFRLSSIPF